MVFKHTDATELVIKAFYRVYGTLGYGFLEKVYGNAMVIEMRRLGLDVVQEERIAVYYDGEVMGEYFADLLAADAAIVGLKAVRGLLEEHEAQMLNYLKATPYEVGLLPNFGPKPEIKRKAFDNSRKGSMNRVREQAAQLVRICEICVPTVGWASVSEKRACYT